MLKRRSCKLIAIVIIFALLFINWGSAAIADGNEGTAGIVPAGETPLIPIEGGTDEGGEEVMPRDITFGGPTWCTLKTTSKVYYAPYGTGCAETEYTLAAGSGVFVVSRDYDCFYVYWYDNNKEMYGYLPMSVLNQPSSYVWTEYDVYRPGKCTATTTVLSYAGTANSYHVIGEIWANENPLMILGKQKNPYNNVTYYFVQYQNEDGLVKRGWVDSSLGTVTIKYTYTDNIFYDSGPFCFVNRATGKVITWDRATNNLVQKTKDGSLEQFFFFEKVGANASVPGYGYVRILSAADPTMAFTVEDKGYAEGLRIKIAEKVSIDKKQEFMIKKYYIESFNAEIPGRVYSKVFTRSTGQYRTVEVYGGLAAENTKIIQSYDVSGTNQQWEILRIDPHWAETFGQYSGSASPVNRKVHYDPSLTGHISFATIQECVNRWNSAYNLSLQVVSGGSQTVNNCLATIINGSLSGHDIDGYCSPVIYTAPGNATHFEYLESSNHVNDKWFSTRIVIDFSKLTACSEEEIMGLICHELGHSLKMSHTYMHLVYRDSIFQWDIIDTPVSIMTANSERGTYTPAGIEIDEYRIAQKWDGV